MAFLFVEEIVGTSVGLPPPASSCFASHAIPECLLTPKNKFQETQ